MRTAGVASLNHTVYVATNYSKSSNTRVNSESCKRDLSRSNCTEFSGPNIASGRTGSQSLSLRVTKQN